MRKKIALYACVVLGPLMVIASIIGMVKDHKFSSESIIVDAAITGQEVIRASKGPDQVRFRVSLSFSDERPPQESFLTVYESQAPQVMTMRPLKVAYLEEDSRSVRLPNEAGQAWMPAIVGFLMSIAGFHGIKKRAALKAEILCIEKRMNHQSEDRNAEGSSVG